MKLRRRRLFRSMWFSYFAVCLATSGIYGLNRGTLRQIILTALVFLAFAAIAGVVLPRIASRNRCFAEFEDVKR